MNLFYAPEIESELCLPEEESFHAVKVLRMKEGDVLDVFDGKGGLYKARISFLHPKRCELSIIDKIEPGKKKDYHIHIAIAPTKNMDRLEWFIEKVTEIGIDEITPVFCRFSERKTLKTERLQKILISASKQSLHTYIPKLNLACSLQEILKKSVEQKFIAHCYEDTKGTLSSLYKPKGNVLILIGPEGDFSKEEVDEALKNGFIPVSLGESRLRTETAGIAACCTVHIIEELNKNI